MNDVFMLDSLKLVSFTVLSSTPSRSTFFTTSWSIISLVMKRMYWLFFLILLFQLFLFFLFYFIVFFLFWFLSFLVNGTQKSAFLASADLRHKMFFYLQWLGFKTAPRGLFKCFGNVFSVRFYTMCKKRVLEPVSHLVWP